MDVNTACDVINSGKIHYKPGWTIKAEPYTQRYEGTCLLSVEFDALDTNRECALKGYPNTIHIHGTHHLPVEDCENEKDLFYLILCILINIETHEAREFFRIGDSRDAPFHPHRIHGMLAWESRSNPLATLLPDFKFAVAHS